jgi:hypothetical protein
MGEYADSALRHYELLGTHLENTKGYKEYGQMQNALRMNSEPFRQGFFRSHPWGTPDQAIRRATELAKAFGTDEIMFVFKYGSMPMAEAEKSMRLFAGEVMPALRETPSGAVDGYRALVVTVSESTTRRQIEIGSAIPKGGQAHECSD